MTVRDPGYDPRRPRRRRDGAHPMNARRPLPGWVPPAAIVGALVLVIALGLGTGLLGGGGGSMSPSGTTAAAGGSASPSTGPGALASGDTTAAPSPPSGEPSPGESASPTVTPAPATTTAEVAIVPVINFRSTRTSVRAADLKAIAGGTGPLAALVVVERDAEGILDALGLDRAAFGKRLVTVRDVAALAANLAKNRTRLGLLRADEVDASVRALAWGAKSLFGVDRVARLDGWPLKATLVVAADEGPDANAFDPGTAWTLVAGGDILLDRGVSLSIQASSKGADVLFNGGTVDITGRCKDCSSRGWDTPYTKRTGNAGVVRDLVKGADIAIANFENPAPDAFRFHAGGTVFSANPKSIAGLAGAGIDWVSLANNHIGDAGRKAIIQTMANLDDYGIRHSGAGKNAAQAHKAALMTVGDVTVGILGYDTIAPGYQAGPATVGSARMTKAALKADVKAARDAGADVVIVFPHWGVEYTTAVTATQQRLGHAAIDAGADMVIGNHPHWVGAMEVYKGRLIWYALGNFVFDQTWSIPTMEGITLELTFEGTRLVQARIRPHLILNKAQPNFLDPAGDGREVMNQLFRASEGRLDW